MLFTLGALLPSPFPLKEREGEGEGKEAGETRTSWRSETKGGWKLYQWDRQHGVKMTYCAQHKRVYNDSAAIDPVTNHHISYM